jgi:hypothetical protein
MNRVWLFLTIILINTSCEHTKWENIKGEDIKFGVPEAIYFENLKNGVIGSYILEENSKSKNYDKLDIKPIAYYTKDGGKYWTLLKFNDSITGGVQNLYLSNDTIYCQIDYNPSKIYLSTNIGKTWNKLDLEKSKIIENNKFRKNRYDIKNYNFEYNNEKYRIKEKYQLEKTIVIICYGKESMTDYFFVSHNNGENWTYLQEEFGSNRQKFLYKDRFLISYDSNLQKLKLK